MRYEVIKLSDLQVDSALTAGMQYAVYRVTLSALDDGSEVRELMATCPTDYIARHVADALMAYPITTNRRTFTIKRGAA